MRRVISYRYGIRGGAANIEIRVVGADGKENLPLRSK